MGNRTHGLRYSRDDPFPNRGKDGGMGVHIKAEVRRGSRESQGGAGGTTRSQGGKVTNKRKSTYLTEGESPSRSKECPKKKKKI